MSSMKTPGAPWVRGGSHELDMQRRSAPGTGLGYPMCIRWCFACERKKTSLGGKYFGRLFKCADCVGEPSR